LVVKLYCAVTTRSERTKLTRITKNIGKKLKHWIIQHTFETARRF